MDKRDMLQRDWANMQTMANTMNRTSGPLSGQQLVPPPQNIMLHMPMNNTPLNPQLNMLSAPYIFPPNNGHPNMFAPPSFPPFTPMGPMHMEALPVTDKKPVLTEQQRASIEKEKLRNRRNAAEQRRKQKLALAADREEIRSLHAQVTAMATELGECRAQLSNNESSEMSRKITRDVSTDTDDLQSFVDGNNEENAQEAKRRRVDHEEVDTEKVVVADAVADVVPDFDSSSA